ncbi:MAG TPA: hypothetical protein VF821_00215 [Lentzea sp.]
MLLWRRLVLLRCRVWRRGLTWCRVLWRRLGRPLLARDRLSGLLRPRLLVSWSLVLLRAGRVAVLVCREAGRRGCRLGVGVASVLLWGEGLRCERSRRRRGRLVDRVSRLRPLRLARSCHVLRTAWEGAACGTRSRAVLAGGRWAVR